MSVFRYAPLLFATRGMRRLVMKCYDRELIRESLREWPISGGSNFTIAWKRNNIYVCAITKLSVMPTTTFFEVCEWIRSGIDVRILDGGFARQFSFSTDMKKNYLVADRFSISTGKLFVVIK